jgi:hypothetical protein
MVTEATARRFWPGRDPVGRTIVAATSPETVLEIVGIVRDAHVSNVANTESAYLYLPAGPSVQRRLALLVRGKTDPEPLARSIRSTIERLDAGLLAQVKPLGGKSGFLAKGVPVGRDRRWILERPRARAGFERCVRCGLVHRHSPTP